MVELWSCENLFPHRLWSSDSKLRKSSKKNIKPKTQGKQWKTTFWVLVYPWIFPELFSESSPELFLFFFFEVFDVFFAPPPNPFAPLLSLGLSLYFPWVVPWVFPWVVPWVFFVFSSRFWVFPWVVPWVFFVFWFNPEFWGSVENKSSQL